MLADRLSQVGDAGVQRLERRVAQVAETLERQRAESVSGMEERLERGRDRDAEPAPDASRATPRASARVLEARLQELAHRIDDAVASARDKLARLEELADAVCREGFPAGTRTVAP